MKTIRKIAVALFSARRFVPRGNLQKWGRREHFACFLHTNLLYILKCSPSIRIWLYRYVQALSYAISPKPRLLWRSLHKRIPANTSGVARLSEMLEKKQDSRCRETVLASFFYSKFFITLIVFCSVRGMLHARSNSEAQRVPARYCNSASPPSVSDYADRRTSELRKHGQRTRHQKMPEMCE